MTEITEGHTVKRYDGELGRLHSLILEMGGLVIHQLEQAIAALQMKDFSVAREIIAGDRAVDDLEVKIDDEVFHLLARRQPMARDLRMILVVSKAVTDLERVGDGAKKIGALALHLYDSDGNEPNHGMLRDVATMGKLATTMLRDALDAFDRCDLERSIMVAQQQNEADEEFEAALRRLTTFVLEDARNVGYLVSVVLILKALERVCGHAQNLCEYCVYLVKGKDVRHTDLSGLAEQLLPK
jgi:phosphate transport system protein